MDSALQQQLFEKFPLIFSERSMPETESAMCLGLQVGDGWYALMDALCTQLQRSTDQDGSPQIFATEVKSKFGSLRFRTRDSDDCQKAMIALAREFSLRTCEVCGAPGRTISSRLMAGTRCANHSG